MSHCPGWVGLMGRSSFLSARRGPSWGSWDLVLVMIWLKGFALLFCFRSQRAHWLMNWAPISTWVLRLTKENELNKTDNKVGGDAPGDAAESEMWVVCRSDCTRLVHLFLNKNGERDWSLRGDAKPGPSSWGRSHCSVLVTRGNNDCPGGWAYRELCTLAASQHFYIGENTGGCSLKNSRTTTLLWGATRNNGSYWAYSVRGGKGSDNCPQW